MKYLHLISFPEFFEGELQQVIAILDQCDVLLHLRKPDASEDEYEAFVRQIPDRYYAKIILHSAYHLVHEFAFAGLHFSTSKREEAKGFEKEKTLSTSCHSLAELKSLSEGFSSCFLSPVFSSISKQGYTGELKLDEVVGFLRKRGRIQVIALGGIDEDNIKQVQAMGFDGAAVLGAVWGANPKSSDHFVDRVKAISHKIVTRIC